MGAFCDGLAEGLVFFAKLGELWVERFGFGGACPAIGIGAVPSEAVFDKEGLFYGSDFFAGFFEGGEGAELEDAADHGVELFGGVWLDFEAAAVVAVILYIVVASGAAVFGIVGHDDGGAFFLFA